METLQLEKLSPTSCRPPQPSRVVLQVVMPSSARIRVEDKPWSEGHAYRFAARGEKKFTLAAYNFSPRPVKGRISVTELPPGWTIEPNSWNIELEPMARQTFPMTFRADAPGGKEAAQDDWVRVKAILDREPPAVVAFRMVAE